MIFISKSFSECTCNLLGSQDIICNGASGQCDCFDNISGRDCDTCTKGYFDFPNCKGTEL